MEKLQLQLNYALILEKIYEVTAEICATIKNSTLELRFRDSTTYVQMEVQVTFDYGINQNIPEVESTEIKEELISPDNPRFCNLEKQKKQKLRFQTTKQRRCKEKRKRSLLQRKGFILSQRLLQAIKMDPLAEREASLWKPVWNRKKARIRFKKKFKIV